MDRLSIAKILLLGYALLAFTPRLPGAQQESGPTEGQVLHVFVGKSVIINVQAPITRVLSSNPAAIEALATSPTQVVLEGKAAGTSSLTLWDQSGNVQLLDVIVDLDLSTLRATIEQAYPNHQVNVQADGNRVILSGKVADSKSAEDLAKMATLYSPQVVNSLALAQIAHDRQVMLEVKFAEVDRTKLDQFGINIISTGASNTPGTITTQQFGPPVVNGSLNGIIGAPVKGTSSSFSFTDLLNVFFFRPDLNLGATIKALQEKSVLQILAEPNLLAMNGQKASFISGGEFPFPMVQGGANVGAVTVQFRPFGVKLDFTAFIGNDDVVRLHVAPEVSTLDFTNALTISGFTIPAISTRRAETEIELRDGQSFGIAGLIDRRAQAQLSKIPGIGDIPILGQLFRSRSINRTNAELVVIVTPHIVDPVRAGGPVPPEPKVAIPYLDLPGFDKNLPGAAAPTPQQSGDGK